MDPDTFGKVWWGGRVVKVHRTITRTAKVTRPVHKRLDEFLEQQRQLWNAALHERIDAYGKCRKSITKFEHMKSLTVIRGDDPDYSKFHVGTQRSILNRLDEAFKRFFANVKAGATPGFPKFKGKGRPVTSFDVPKPLNLKGGALNVKGIGKLRVRKGIPEGTHLGCRVVRTPNRVELQFMVEREVSGEREVEPMVGIDMGVKERAILSTGEMIPRVTIDRTELKRRQRAVARG